MFSLFSKHIQDFINYILDSSRKNVGPVILQVAAIESEVVNETLLIQ